MAGLLNPQEQQPMPAQSEAPQQPGASSDLSQQYEEAQLYVERFAAHPQASDKLADMIAGAESMEAGLAEAAAFMLIRVEAHFELSDEVKLELIGDIMESVFEIAGEMGLLDESDVTEDLIQSVMSLGTQRYAEMHEQAGMPLDPNEARSELDELESSGAIDEARTAMPEDADSLNQLVHMARQGG
ncbi:hypothetical protein [Aliidiomarina maris]|uniref:Uncharacterized protein n=1 Tax=Aliidiomarina maris TaxID=531312 RepID=A0A327X4M7_9GAMM|nr:hypothetical protein [Aliidiomarina maris]RAK01599.1 hypothetical protein B0I24_101222 [Aliidiomarina maris]RUO28425.1 hypothetical protein CWE07_01060 [Aliidiomarina maris]